MACPVSQIDALVAACGGCKPRPSRRVTYLAQEISPNLAATGMTYQCDFTGVPLRDSVGRIAHVRGIKIETSVQLARDAGDGPLAAIDSHMLRAFISGLKLQGRGNWLYTETLDERDIVDDSWCRNLRIKNMKPLASDITTETIAGTAVPAGEVGYPVPDQVTGGFGSAALAADTRNDTIDISTSFDFTTEGESPLHGLIPLFELLTSVNGSLRLTFAPPFALTAIDAGTTLTGFTVPESNGSVACRVWLDLVYIDALIVDPRWKIDSYTVDRLKGVAKYQDMVTRYLALRNHEDEAPLGTVDGIATGSLNLEIAGFNEIQGLSADRMRSRLMAILSDRTDSELEDFNRSVALPAFLPTNGANVFAPGNRTRQIDLLVPYSNKRRLSPAGPVNYAFSAWAGQETFQRVLHRVIECTDTARVKEGARMAYGPAAGRCRACTVDDEGNVQPDTAANSTDTIVVKP